jgi:hypothetical protein
MRGASLLFDNNNNNTEEHVFQEIAGISLAPPWNPTEVALTPA